MTTTLPEDLLPIICDHYATTSQLRALATVSLLNHRISGYARTRLFKQFEFIDDRSSRVLDHANTLCTIYEQGELLDEDILAVVDSKEIDPLDLDPELRWLKGMRMCETIVIKDLLYGRDIESIITLSTSLSERKLVLFPKVEKLVIGGKLVKRILATEQRGPRPKITPLDLLIAMFHATRPKILDIQDSAIFTPPPNDLIRMIAQQDQVGGRTSPSRGGHMSHTIIQFIESMESIQEIRYHAVNPDIPIYPKKGIHHVVHFIPDPSPEVVVSLFTGPRSHKEKIVREIKDVITRSIVGRYEMMQDIGMFGSEGGGGGGGGGLFGGGTAAQGAGGVGLFGGGGAGTLFGTGTGAGNGGVGLFGGATGGQLFGTAISVGNGGGGVALFGTGAGNGGSFGQGPTFGTGTHAHFPLFGTHPQVQAPPPLQLFGTQPQIPFGQIPVRTGAVPPATTGGTNINTNNTSTGTTTVTGMSSNTIHGSSTSNSTSSANCTNAVAGPSTVSNPRERDDDDQSTRSDGDTYNSNSNTDSEGDEEEDELPAYAPPTHTRPRPVDDTISINPNIEQSSWYFLIPPREIGEVRRQVMFWAERIKGDIGDQVRSRIRFGVIGEEEACDCGI